MARTSTTGYLRQYGSNGKNATPAVFMSAVYITFDPTQSSSATGVILPKGARASFVQLVDAGATGGASPTVNIGTQSTANAFGADLPADDPQNLGFGADAGVELSDNTEIYAGVGSSAATGGSVTAAVFYIMQDDGEA